MSPLVLSTGTMLGCDCELKEALGERGTRAGEECLKCGLGDKLSSELAAICLCLYGALDRL